MLHHNLAEAQWDLCPNKAHPKKTAYADTCLSAAYQIGRQACSYGEVFRRHSGRLPGKDSRQLQGGEATASK